MFKKNTAVTGFPFALVSATDGSAITAGTVTGYYVLDGGTQGTIAGTPVHEGNGQWSVNLLAAEMNGDTVGLLFNHASAVNVHFTIKTVTKLVSELNDIAATAIVSAGAITTLSGAVVNVDTVDTCTTNTDLVTAAAIRAEMDTNSTKLADILADTAVIGLAGAGLTALATQASVNTLSGYVDTEITDIQSRLPAALVGGRMDSNLSAIGNSTAALEGFKRAVKGNIIGTIGVGSTTTSVVSSSLTPAGTAADQFKGRYIVFADDTTTAALRGQASDITANTASATPTFTVTALTTAPAASDIFSIT